MSKTKNSNKIRTTISIDKNVLKKFKEYCKERGMKLSPKIELYMTLVLKGSKDEK